VENNIEMVFSNVVE